MQKHCKGPCTRDCVCVCGVWWVCPCVCVQFELSKQVVQSLKWRSLGPNSDIFINLYEVILLQPVLLFTVSSPIYIRCVGIFFRRLHCLGKILQESISFNPNQGHLSDFGVPYFHNSSA